MISPVTKLKIEQIINAFETGSAAGNYGKLVKYRDYKHPTTGTYMVQITYGRAQTTEFGNLKALLQSYINKGGAYAGLLKPFVSKIGKQASLATDILFCDTLRNAGSDPVMIACQDELFDSYYYLPALGWFSQMGFTLPLSLLVIYDSHIHSGSIPGFLRKRFTEAPPIKGGSEKDWIKQYVDARHEWLKTHPNKILNNTIYRTNCFKQQIKMDNWQLDNPVNANGIIIT